MFPLKMMGASIAGDTQPPSGANPAIACSCQLSTEAMPSVGISAGFWNPTRVIEITRNPYCTPTLGGKKLADSYQLFGGALTQNNDTSDGQFRNYHMLAFPLMQMLSMLADNSCNPEGYVDLDIVDMTEFNPMWNDPELSFFVNPFGAMFAELENMAAGAASCAATAAGIDDDWNFWSAGCLGNIYPADGKLTSEKSQARDTSLYAVRGLTLDHMTGRSRRTWGADAVCKAQLSPILPKSGYRIQRLFPVAESSKPCCHRLGASTFSWGGEYRNLPGVSDYVYMLWKYTDCCVMY
jgi:conjugal transfer pilus assembly protein TraU